ncbi:hypothetical protein ACOSQ3_019187 [Xanthoceras sorbifolium]
MSGEGKVVCVTGAADYIASWLVNQLLQHGYTVKATVRDPNDPMETEYLRAIDGVKQRLQIFKANLLEEGSFDSAVDGCDGVFHTASPVLFSANDPKADIVDTAVKDTVVDETWFSDPVICEKTKNWYALSKTLAKAAAWKFAEENGIDLVAINPGVVIGSLLQPTLNLSVEIILKLVTGDQSFPSPHRLVDVKDVAHAHIQALEVPSASGRYCVVESIRSSTETLKSFARMVEDDKPIEPTYQVSREKAESLGINDFISWEVSLKDTIESLKKGSFLSF